jgi:hypothetical protein
LVYLFYEIIFIFSSLKYKKLYYFSKLKVFLFMRNKSKKYKNNKKFINFNLRYKKVTIYFFIWYFILEEFHQEVYYLMVYLKNVLLL